MCWRSLGYAVCADVMGWAGMVQRSISSSASKSIPNGEELRTPVINPTGAEKPEIQLPLASCPHLHFAYTLPPISLNLNLVHSLSPTSQITRSNHSISGSPQPNATSPAPHAKLTKTCHPTNQATAYKNFGLKTVHTKRWVRRAAHASIVARVALDRQRVRCVVWVR